MKSEVIDKILSVEENAQTIRDEAEEKARNIVLDAQSESARIVKEALAEERKRGDELVADASRLLDEKLRKIDEEMKKTAMKNSTGAVCPNCGKSVESGAVFCTFCGTRISDAEAADMREEIPEDICPNCGVQIKPGQLFCVKCGAKLQG